MAGERVYVFLMQRRDGRPERVVVWDTQDISVGRSPENDVVVDDPEMSRKHARFYREGGRWCVQNISMSNPTFVGDQSITAQALANKDVVRIADTEFVFCSVRQNPVTLGVKVEYASQLKGFGPQIAAGDGEATILGLMDTVGGDGADDFVVRPAGDFEHDLHGVERTQARDLDLELAGDGLDDLDMRSRPEKKPALEAWTLQDGKAPGALSLTLEIEGLSGAQRASVAALLGKVIELPRLRVRIKGDDLG